MSETEFDYMEWRCIFCGSINQVQPLECCIPCSGCGCDWQDGGVWTHGAVYSKPNTMAVYTPRLAGPVSTAMQEQEQDPYFEMEEFEMAKCGGKSKGKKKGKKK